MNQPIPITADTGEEITIEMALEQASRATELATDLAGALEEARALLIQVLAIEPHELEPPILKEQGDLAYARTLDRKLLEEKYVLARMATRLSMRKVHDLEGKVELLEYRQNKRDAKVNAERDQLATPDHGLVAHMHRQIAFSRKTFGPGSRHKGVIDHIRKELHEIEDAPEDLEEWIDVVLLAFDGAWRAGHSAEQVAAALDAKMTKNEQRKWPDWRTADKDKAIEHDRAEEA